LRFSLNKLPAETKVVPPLIPLEFVPDGEWAEIGEITGEPVWVHRMAELGLRTGSQFQVVRQGSPCLVQIGCSRLSLRGKVANQIMVRPLVAR
jgi:ferrous iron transport protein A